MFLISYPDYFFYLLCKVDEAINDEESFNQTHQKMHKDCIKLHFCMSVSPSPGERTHTQVRAAGG